MISNVGNEGESTHCVANVKLLPKGLRKLFNMKTYDYDFPLNHPKYVIEDRVFLKRINRIMGVGHPFVRFYRKVESAFYRVKSGDFSMIKKFWHMKE